MCPAGVPGYSGKSSGTAGEGHGADPSGRQAFIYADGDVGGRAALREAAQRGCDSRVSGADFRGIGKGSRGSGEREYHPASGGGESAAGGRGNLSGDAGPAAGLLFRLSGQMHPQGERRVLHQTATAVFYGAGGGADRGVGRVH